MVWIRCPFLMECRARTLPWVGGRWREAEPLSAYYTYTLESERRSGVLGIDIGPVERSTSAVRGYVDIFAELNVELSLKR